MRLQECRMPEKVFMIFELEMLFRGLGEVVNYEPMVLLFLHGAVVVVERLTETGLDQKVLGSFPAASKIKMA